MLCLARHLKKRIASKMYNIKLLVIGTKRMFKGACYATCAFFVTNFLCAIFENVFFYHKPSTINPLDAFLSCSFYQPVYIFFVPLVFIFVFSFYVLIMSLSLPGWKMNFGLLLLFLVYFLSILSIFSEGSSSLDDIFHPCYGRSKIIMRMFEFIFYSLFFLCGLHGLKKIGEGRLRKRDYSVMPPIG